MASPAEELASSKDHTPKNINRTVMWLCNARSRRELLRLTTTEVSEAIGVSQSNLATVENGYDLLLTTAVKISNFYGCGVTDIWSPLPNLLIKDKE